MTESAESNGILSDVRLSGRENRGKIKHFEALKLSSVFASLILTARNSDSAARSISEIYGNQQERRPSDGYSPIGDNASLRFDE